MDIIKRPSSYPMLAIKYSDSSDPFFEVNVMTSLAMINSSSTMKEIFRKIKEAQPEHRPSSWPRMCNVLITPPIDRAYQTGLTEFGFETPARRKAFDSWQTSKDAKHGLKLKMAAKCQAQADSKKHSQFDRDGKQGTGSVCYMFFTNKEVMTKSGEPLPMHITLAHELIHCMHYLYGDSMWESRDEEHRTVGLKKFSTEALCENKVRAELGLEERKKYFADD